MSTGSERDEHISLQHAAEHERPHKRMSVMTYLVILIAAAFLLLLMSYFMQQRTNREAYTNLEQTSSSAVESLNNLIAERDTLKGENQRLQAELDQALASSQAAAWAHQAQQEQAEAHAMALTQLNQIRSLYNQREYKQASSLLAEWEAAAPGALEQQLADISQDMSQEERDIYDPLSAYHLLAEWLD